MTVTDTKDFFDEIFDSASAAYSVDMEYLKVVNSVRSAIRKFSDVELIVFPGLPESRIFAKRLWRAAYVVWAFEYCEHTRPPMAASELISGNLTRQQLEKETLGDRVISADAHYFAQTVVSIAYAERTVSDMKRRWQERLVQRVKSYLVFHLAKALYQYSVVTELFKTEQESLHDIVVRYYEMILPDPDFDSLRRRDMSNVYADATHHWDVYDGAQAWKKRREKLKVLRVRP